jgi:hypothetical protein
VKDGKNEEIETKSNLFMFQKEIMKGIKEKAENK